MKLNDEIKLDPRWSAYQERFKSLPLHFFRCLEYPKDPTHAEQMILGIELEIRSISSQFLERKTELEKGIESPQLEEVKRVYAEWAPRAMRAQRMKDAQIKILQAWLVDNAPSSEEAISKLECRISKLEEGLRLLCAILEQNVEGGEYLELQRVFSVLD